MKQGLFIRLFPGLILLSAIVALPVQAQDEEDSRQFQTNLSGFEEVPTLFTPASGEFSATVNEDASEIEYELSYSDFPTVVQAAHLHLGRPGVNGEIIVFLCSNLPNPPANVPACPDMEGDVSGTLNEASVIGPEAQGISPGEFDKLLEAMNNDAVYANVHSEQFPQGELRGQLTTEEEDGAVAEAEEDQAPDQEEDQDEAQDQTQDQTQEQQEGIPPRSQ